MPWDIPTHKGLLFRHFKDFGEGEAGDGHGAEVAYVRGGGVGVLGRAAIGADCHREVAHQGVDGGGAHAVGVLCARYYQSGYAEFFKKRVETSFVETAEAFLYHYMVAGLRRERFYYFGAVGSFHTIALGALEQMPAVWLAVAAVRVVAADNVDYRPAVAACMVEEPDASRNGFGGSGNAQRTSRLHKVALHVDYYHCFHAPEVTIFSADTQIPEIFWGFDFHIKIF